MSYTVIHHIPVYARRTKSRDPDFLWLDKLNFFAAGYRGGYPQLGIGNWSCWLLLVWKMIMVQLIKKGTALGAGVGVMMKNLVETTTVILRAKMVADGSVGVEKRKTSAERRQAQVYGYSDGSYVKQLRLRVRHPYGFTLCCKTKSGRFGDVPEYSHM